MRKRRPVEAVQRALALLQLVADRHDADGLGVTEAALAIGVNKSSASRLLSTLVGEGFLAADPRTRRHHIGPMSFVVGSRFAGAEMTRSVLPIIRALSEASGFTAQFGALEGTTVLYLAVVQSNAHLRVVASPGDVRPAHVSSIGKAIMASLPAGTRDSFVHSLVRDGWLPAVGPGSIRRPAALLADLDRTAARGYSQTDEEAGLGVAAIGAYVPNPTDIPTALSVAFPDRQLVSEQRAELVELVRRAAGECQRVLKGDA